MQTYVFTVAISGEDVQDLAEEVREKVIDSFASNENDMHVTESVRVTK